jgi:hypothetical protein
MTPLAVSPTGNHVPPWVIFGVTALLAVAAYVCSCWWFPYGACWCCKGVGLHFREDRKVHRKCWWCKGSGRRLRIGRRFYNVIQRRRRRAES